MADIIRSTLKKRMAEADEPESMANVPTSGSATEMLNTHKRTMTQAEFGNAGKEDPRKKKDKK